MSWFLAPSLEQLIGELNDRWPKRSKTHDGTIGDDAHAARKSEHNPNRDEDDDVPDGAVTAADITKAGIAAEILREKLIADPRTWYVIHRGKIWSRTHGFAERDYDGPNPHDKHLHLSLRQTSAAVNSRAPWGIAVTEPTPEPEPNPGKPFLKLARGVKPGVRHAQVPDLQRFLLQAGYGPIQGAVTNYYGPETERAVARFYARHSKLSSKPVDTSIGAQGFRHLQEEARARTRR